MNTIAIAEMLDISGVIFLEGVIPNEDVIKKADELNLLLMSSQQSAYSLSKKLVSLGI
jgi:hypothetical protein